MTTVFIVFSSSLPQLMVTQESIHIINILTLSASGCVLLNPQTNVSSLLRSLTLEKQQKLPQYFDFFGLANLGLQHQSILVP